MRRIVLFILIIFICLLSHSSYAQHFIRIYETASFHDWQKGNDLLKINQSYFVCGDMKSPIISSDNDAIVMCLNLDATIKWQRNYGSVNRESMTQIISSKSQESLIGYGYTGSLVKRNPWLIRIDTSGTKIWEVVLVDPDNTISDIGNISLSDYGYLVSGCIKANNSGPDRGFFLSLIDSMGNTKWSKVYYTEPHNYNFKSARFCIIKDDVFVFGVSGNIISMIRLSIVDGEIIDINSYVSMIDGMSFIQVYGALYDSINNKIYTIIQGEDIINRYVLILKINFNENYSFVDFCKIYSQKLTGNNWFLSAGKPIITKNGGVLFGGSSSMITSIDSSGNVIFSNSYAFTSSLTPLLSVFEDSDHYFAVGDAITNVSPGRDILFLKVNKDGTTPGCCTVKREWGTPSVEELYYSHYPSEIKSKNYYNFISMQLTPMFNRILSPMEICQNMQIIKYDTISICEGDSVFIDNKYYYEPQSFFSTVKDISGECDTLLFTTIEYWKPRDGDVYDMNLICPQDIEVYLDGAAQKAKVYYDYPDLITECYCNNHEIKLIEGISSGEDFPLGVITNCYEARDACGNYSSCCFTVSVKSKKQQPFCDEKKIDCLSFRLLSMKVDSLGNRVFRCEVLNECSSPIRYIYFEMPKGIVARYPSNLSFYLSQSGREYQVRNPHHSLFYSISFQPSGQLFLSGYSDIFEYALPPQAHVQYFKAAVRLASGKYYEVHLNTFKCSQEYSENPPIYHLESRKQFEGISVIPNPVRRSGNLYFNIEKDMEYMVFIYDISGRILHEGRLHDNSLSVRDIGLHAGMYLYTLIFGDGSTARGKFFVTD